MSQLLGVLGRKLTIFPCVPPLYLPTSFLTVGSTYAAAAVRLLYKLPGECRLVRRSHLWYAVGGTGLLYRDLVDVG